MHDFLVRHPLLEKIEKINSKLILPAIVILFILILIELFFHVENEEQALAVEILDFIVIAVFVVDLIFLGIKAKSTRFFFKQYWLDLLAVFPFVLLFKLFESFARFFTAAERITVGQAIFHESLEVSKAAARAERFAKFGRYVRVGARIIRVFSKTKLITRFKRRKKNRVR